MSDKLGKRQQDLFETESRPVFGKLAAGCLDFYHKPVKTTRRKFTVQSATRTLTLHLVEQFP